MNVNVANLYISISLGLAIVLSATASVVADEQVRVVGSSTVYPFSTVVAERFGRSTNFKTPIIESTGTGGGFKLFCAGTDLDTVDITNASRAIAPSEEKMCTQNGVTNIIEVKMGYDGIVLANGLNSRNFSITTRDIYLALAETVPSENGEFKKNTATLWSDINPDLPPSKIEVLGPPPTSGTRDAFVNLAMEAGCVSVPALKQMAEDKDPRFKEICHTIRKDGAYIEAGENDNLIIQKLTTNENALGIFGFSFLNQNNDRVKAASINGVQANFTSIADGSYVISRPLFFYVKGEKIKSVNSLKPFIETFISDTSIGQNGYLTYRGLIPMSNQERTEYQNTITHQLNSLNGGIE
jgi:phosphate transport system substrate-binding protein